MKYGARYDAVKKILEDAKQQERDRAEDPSKLPENDWKRIETVIDSYFNDRSKIMETAIGMLNDKSATADDQADRWSEHFQKAAENAHKRISDLISGKDRKTFGPFSFYEQIHRISVQEPQFLSVLSGLPLAGMQGRINDHRKKFEEEQKNLRDKFNDLKSKDRGFDDRIKRTVDDLTGMYEKSIEDVVDKHLQVSRKFVAWVHGFRKADDTTSPGTPSWLDPLDYYLRALDAMLVSPKTYRQRLDEAFRSEGTLIILFDKTRRDVKKFLDGVNLELVEKETEDTKKTALDQVSKWKNPGHNEDGKAFVEDTAKAVQMTLWSYSVVFNSFIDEFRGVFLGPVGDRTVADLLEPREGEDAGKRIKGLHVERQLKDLYNEARDWDVDFDGISEKHRAHIQKMIHDHLDRLAPKIQRTGDLTMADANAIAIKLMKKDEASKMKSLPGWDD